MKISTRGRYGLKAMVDIAAHENEKCITLKSIAERQGMSEHYLEQLVAALKKAGYVKSERGAQGGYNLNCDPKELSVGDILRTMEGSLYPVDCISDSEKASCGSADCEGCVTKPVWEKLYDSYNEVLNNIYLAELVEDYKCKSEQ